MSNPQRDRQSRYLASVFAPLFGRIVNDVHVGYNDSNETITISMMGLPSWEMTIGSDDEFYDFVSGDCSLIVPFEENAS